MLILSKRKMSAITAVSLIAAGTLMAAGDSMELVDFSSNDSSAQIKPSDQNTVKGTLVESNGQKVLDVKFSAGKGYPGVAITPKSGTWDLSAFTYVDAKFRNTGTTDVRLALRADNEGEWKKEPWNTELLTILPGKEGTMRVKFGFSYGAAGYKLDSSKVTQILIFVGDPKNDVNLQVLWARAGGRKGAETAVFPDKDGNLVKFGPDFDTVAVIKNGAEINNAGTEKIPTVIVTTYANKGWPGVNIPAPNGKWDLSGYEFITLDARNIDKHDIDLFVRIDNPGANGRDNCMTERIGIQPDQRVTMTIPLKRKNTTDIKLFGMNGYPQGLFESGGIDPSNIVAVTLFTASTPTDNTVEVSNLRAFGKYETPKWASMNKEAFFPFIDEFGQFIHKDWPGKTKSVEDMQKRRDEEKAQLESDAGPKEWDKWGGWANGPQLKATGNFRTEKHNGKWWLVDPDGRLFFSTGITCVNMNAGSTILADRDSWFKDLPAKDSPLGKFRFKHWKIYSGCYAGKEPEAFNFSEANLMRKYGDDYKNIYPDVVHRRLRSWGLNTIANWSFSGIYLQKKTPYTATFWYSSPNLKDNKMKFPDVFNPEFAKVIDQRVKEWLKDTHDDPWCIGYFVDNEMEWGGDDALGRNTLLSPAKQAAKQKLMSFLQERYPDIAALNGAWGTTFADWDEFAADTKSKPNTDKAAKDLVDFTGLTADTYFRTIKETIKKYAPNRLYLGCRCVGGSSNIIEAAVKYCDVVSYNRYCASVRDITLPDKRDAPVIIGEFHFGGLDRGLFWGGLFSAETQSDRAAKYKAYVESALDNPQIVGVHWFQYSDEATTGRDDGENAQCGFIDICDTPYAETTKAAREMGEKMYQTRSK